VIRQEAPRKIRVDFAAPHAGVFQAVLKITFSDQAKSNAKEWLLTRELRGCAVLPANGGRAIIGETPHTMDEMANGESAGITVFPYFALDFSVECPQPNEPYATQTKDFIVSRSSPTPLVSFTAATVRSPDVSMTK
jgi:hypothetical protein